MHGTIESLFRVEWRPLAELSPIAAEWRALAGRALEPNVFYEPAFALAAQPVFGRDVGAGLVWSRSSEPRLLGFFPARIERRRYGCRCRCWSAGPIRTGRSARRWSTATRRSRDRRLVRSRRQRSATAEPAAHCRIVPASSGPLARRARCRALCAARGAEPQRCVRAAHARALLAPAGDGARDYLERAIGPKKRKELRRQRRRLGDGGVVMSSSAVKQPPSRVRSTISSRSKRAAGRAAPEPRRAPMPTCASSCKPR